MDYCITPQRLARIRSVLARRQKDLTLVMDNVHDPHNVSAILRSCDAFGVPEVQLFYTTTPFPDIGKKSSGSARKWVKRRRHATAQSLADFAGCHGFNLLATGFSERAKPLHHWDLTRPTAVILSNEHDGVSRELAALAHGEVHIPMVGMVQSFNVSVAAAIILYEAFRQRSAAGLYDTPTLGPDELEALEREWARR